MRNLSTLGWLHDSFTRPASPRSRGDDGSDAERPCAKPDGVRSRTAGEGSLKVWLPPYAIRACLLLVLINIDAARIELVLMTEVLNTGRGTDLSLIV